MTTETLEKEVEKEFIIHCGYCNREISPKTAYKSPYGGKYCDEHCYNMFTED